VKKIAPMTPPAKAPTIPRRVAPPYFAPAAPATASTISAPTPIAVQTPSSVQPKWIDGALVNGIVSSHCASAANPIITHRPGRPIGISPRHASATSEKSVAIT
jgi:hypothetical protein